MFFIEMDVKIKCLEIVKAIARFTRDHDGNKIECTGNTSKDIMKEKEDQKMSENIYKL